MSPESTPRKIVIVGGGIVGCTTAYYLSQHPKFNPSRGDSITLLEASSVAAGASGKAAGLLGTWAHPSCLAKLSYRLHAELAAAHNGPERWWYRNVKCGNIRAAFTEQPSETPDADAKLPKKNKSASTTARGHSRAHIPDDLSWINRAIVDSYEEMLPNSAAETAQVHPFLFTTSLAQLARDGGVDIRTRAYVTKIHTSSDGHVEGVEYLDRSNGDDPSSENKQEITGVTDIVVAAGPWTGSVLPSTKVDGRQVHSVVFDTTAAAAASPELAVSPHVLFTDIRLPSDFDPDRQAGTSVDETTRVKKGRNATFVEPEIYPRINGEVYLADPSEPEILVPLPRTADAVSVNPAQCDHAIAYLATISPQIAACPVKTRQACYLPTHTRSGHEAGPLVGPSTQTAGLWVAGALSVWGIQNGPATGKLMSEWILDGEPTSAKISELDPRRYKI